MAARFGKWLDTFLSEKGIDLDEYLDTYRGDEWRSVPVGFVTEHIKVAPPHEREAIKRTLVVIDFKNGDVRHYLAHLGAALWEKMDEFIAVV